MEKKFSSKWKASTKPRKQRKYSFNAPLHLKGKMLHSHLSKDLRNKHGKRSIRVKVGDKVKVMKGQFRGKIGKIASVDLKATRLQVEGIEIIKKDGSKVAFFMHPSNVMITELNTDDKNRMKRLEAKK
ncbi:MAG: large subunit ribosomal protein L24 [archaeon GW2011_AR3]|nr:large subunit ribosomal protein L24 [uncultured archaeon]KHO46810.1 MAG: large subunit ribosomal protein L24 [archaeon GW2011_AR3]MBS3109347.1 50S ribosomal protein L24 [Candidatus Woesearchaeota archaeon]